MNTTRRTRTVTRFLFAVCLPLVAVTAVRAAETPNVIVILTDDLGWGTAGCYGATVVSTPNIDRLAREGRRFTDGNTPCSVCSPTRYAMLTGRYCWRTSLTHEVLNTYAPLHIETTRFNLASLLKKHGYRTAAIGKWHLGYGTAARTDYTAELKPGPLEIGFDYHFGVPSNHGDVTGVYVENHWVYGLQPGTAPASNERNFNGVPFAAINAPRRVDDQVMNVLTDKTVAWLEQQEAGQPFFLYYTPVAVHSPVTPAKERQGTSKAGAFGDWVHELDASMGRVLDVLDRKGLAANTLVLFTSDNGGVNKPKASSPQADAIAAGLAPTGPWRGGKHDVWEGGFRVPYIVRWPGHVPAGSVCDATVNVVDTLASVAAIVGEPLPAAEAGAEDSYNVLPAWLGETSERPLRPSMIVHSADGVFAYRQGPWKFVEGVPAKGVKPAALKARADQHRRQLYNLASDPKETTNVLDEQSEVAAKLAAQLEAAKASGHTR